MSPRTPGMKSVLVRRSLNRHLFRTGCAVSLTALLLAAAGCSSNDAGGGDDGVGNQNVVAGAATFVQVNSGNPQTPQTTVVVPFNAAQTAGNLIVAVVGWNDTTAKVSTITDTKGNVYQLAVGPTTRGSSLSQSIYYAKNIAAAPAGGNSVTVKFTVAASYPDIRIAEYSGLDTVNPVDVVKAATGNNATSNSGNINTTNASDLLIGANMVATGTAGPGTGFTSRVITVPDSDILEIAR